MQAKLIGIGAAGNKAAMLAIEEGVFTRDQVMLLNTTSKDMREEYNDINTTFGKGPGGCGKERNLAKKLIYDCIKEESINFDGFLDPQDDTIVIVSSSEGGTGCGASTIIARYFKQVLGANVHLVVFTGFEEDSRGLKNTVEYFQDLNEEYTVEAISNKKFLSTSRNKQEAENKANYEFVKRMRVYLGLDIVDSYQNIDDTDLLKINITPGFMTIETAELPKIKNTQEFINFIDAMIDDTKSLDFESTAKRIGVFFNITERTQSINLDNSIIKEKLGEPFEFFTHIQTCPKDSIETVSIIASGIKMPIDEVESVYNTYLERTAKVDKSKDSFFESLSTLEVASEDKMFDLGNREVSTTDKAKKAFFVENEELDNTIIVGKKKTAKLEDF